MLLYFHPLNQTFLDHKHPKLHITDPRVLIHTNPQLPFCAVLLTGFCFIQNKQLVIVVTSRRHCLQAESHTAVLSSPLIDAWCSKLYRFSWVLNCPDDGGSKPVRIFSSLMSLYRTVSLNRRATARYRPLASIIPGRERPEETTICYKISLFQLITNLSVILYLSTCHTIYISVLILFMIMP
jgi:hypothetical protein